MNRSYQPLSIYRSFAILSAFGTLATLASAQTVREGGGLILDDKGRLRQEDIIRKSNCSYASFQSLIQENLNWNQALVKLGKAHWYLEDYFRREASVLKLCPTGNLKPEDINDYRDLVIYAESQQTLRPRVRAQLAIRLGDVVFMDMDAFRAIQGSETTTADQEKTIALIHEIAHGILPNRAPNGRPRVSIVSDLSKTIYNVIIGKSTAQDLEIALEETGATQYVPKISSLPRLLKYRADVNVAINSKSTVAERYSALARLDLADALTWLAPVEAYRMVQNTNRDLEDARRILKNTNNETSHRKVLRAKAELQEQLNNGILPNVKVLTLNGPASLIEEAKSAGAHSDLIDLLFSIRFGQTASNAGTSTITQLAVNLIDNNGSAGIKLPHVTIASLISAGLDPNAEVTPDVSVLEYAAMASPPNGTSGENPPFSELLEHAELISDQTLQNTLDAVATLADQGYELPLEQILALKRIKISPSLVWKSYQSNKPNLYAKLLAELNANEMGILIETASKNTLGHLLSSSKPKTQCETQMQKQFFSRTDYQVKQVNWEKKDMIDLAIQNQNLAALAWILSRPGMVWTPKSNIPQERYEQTRLVLGALFNAHQADRSTLEIFTKIAESDRSLKRVDWSEFLITAEILTNHAEFIPLLKKKQGEQK